MRKTDKHVLSSQLLTFWWRPAHYHSIRNNKFEKLQQSQSGWRDFSEPVLVSTGNLFKFPHLVNKQQPPISVEFHSLLCSKTRDACFPHPRTPPKNTYSCLQNLFKTKRLQPQQTSISVLASSLKVPSYIFWRPNYSHWIRASFTNLWFLVPAC